MRILWVKAGGLLPLDSGGRIRSYNLVRELAKAHQVTFFGFHGQEDEAAHAELNSICEQVVCFPLQLPSPKSVGESFRYLAGLASREPYSIRKYYRPHVARELDALVKKGNYDVIVCDFVCAASVIPWDSPSHKVLFTHNVEATIWKRHYEVASNPVWKFIAWREWRAMERAENGHLRKADLVLAVSNADRDVFARVISPEKLRVIPTGVDIDYFAPRPAAEEENLLVFTGSMDWLPNEDGVFYFAKEILPRISQAVPAVRLIVVGRKPSRRLEALAAENNQIQLTGWVEDVRPHVARASACVVPLRVGSGTRLKIFEAMSMGKAVISTTIGAEGLPVDSGRHLLLADRPEDFAKAAVLLLQNKSERRRLGAEARTLVETKFSWASVASEFEHALHNSR